MLYEFVIVDGAGCSRTVRYAFVWSEKYESLKLLFQRILELFGLVTNTRIKTVVMDKLRAQIRAAKEAFQC